MLIDARKFMFTVSLCAMLAVNPVLASAPGENESVGEAHTVYTEGTFDGRVESGIAGVTYVNRAMDAAGIAAQAAESHAAAAGASAISAADSAAAAADSAKTANEALSGKVDVAQGANNANKVMVTDSGGLVTTGLVTADKIYAGGYSGGVLADAAPGTVLKTVSSSGLAGWGLIESDNIADGAIHSGHIKNGVLTVDKMDPYGLPEGAVIRVVEKNGTTGVGWGQVSKNGIADGAVTIDKTDGVVGMVPVGGANATTYANFWIE